MSAQTPMQRAYAALERAGVRQAQLRDHYATVVLTAALDDVDLGPRISTWRGVSCEHSRVVNQWRHDQTGEPLLYEEACSPCVRDRMRSWLLDGAS